MSVFYKRAIAAMLWFLMSAVISAASEDAFVARAKSRLNRVTGHVISKQLAPEGAAATADFVKVPDNLSAIRRQWQSELMLYGPILNPGRGAKIFRFTSLSPDKFQEYKEQVAVISQKIFADYVGMLKAPSVHSALFMSDVYSDDPCLTPEQELVVKETLNRLLAVPVANTDRDCISKFGTWLISYIKSRR